MAGVCQNLVSEASDSSYKMMIDIPDCTKVMHSLVEIRTRQIPHLKGGGTEIDQVQVEEKWMGIPQTPELLVGYPYDPHSHWILWDIVTNDKKDSQCPMTPFCVDNNCE